MNTRLRPVPVGIDAVLNNRSIGAMIFAALIGLAALAITTRFLFNHIPGYDELVHILAARGILATGRPVIADGLYDRAELFSRVVAASVRMHGDNLVSVRLPALISGLLLVGLTGAWATRRVGLLAGASAALILAILPASTELAVIARFYTLHALAILVMLIAGYEAMSAGRHLITRWVLAMLAITMFALAWHLQPTTAIAFGAGLAGLTAVVVVDRWSEVRSILMRHPILCAALAVVWVVAVRFAASRLGFLGQLRQTALWDQENAARLGYYNTALTRDLPLFWPLLPLAALAALIRHRRLAVFCIVAAAMGLIVHSIAAQKAIRYVYYLLPLLAIIWGCGVAATVAALAGLGPRFTGLSHDTAVLLGLALIALIVANSAEGQRAARLAIGDATAIQQLSFAQEPDWQQAMPILRPFIDSADRLIVSNSMKAVYVIGHYDFALNANDVVESESGREFGRDHRTGRPAISTAASLTQVLGTPGRALVIVEDKKLGKTAGATTEVIALLQSRCRTVETPKSSGVSAWLCVANSAKPG